VDQGLEHLVDHREVIAAARELPLEIDQVGVHEVQAAREQPRDLERALRMRVQESQGVVDDVERRRLECPHGRGMRHAQQHRHLAEEGTRIRDGRDLDVALDDLDRPGGEHEQLPGG
jgi:hypothetical protein